MTELFVDIDALQQLVAALSRTGDALASAPALVASAEACMGSDEVSTAFRQFISRWSDGRQTIIEEVAALRDAARGSADAYQQAESTLSGNLRAGGVATASTASHD